MPEVVTVKVDGLSQLGAAFDELSKATARNVGRRVLVQAGQITADMASSLAPDDPSTPSPDLHTSIAVGTKLTKRQAKLNRSSKNTDRSFAEAYVGATKDVNSYASLVEFGTVNTSPRPFLRPAWDATKDAVLASIGKLLGIEIEKAAARARAKALRAAK